MGDFLRLAHTLERDPGGHFFQRFRLHAQSHFGFDEARCNAGDANAVARQFLGPGHGCRSDTGLGRRVVGLTDVASAGNRRDIDDRAAVVQLDHFRRDFTGAQEHAGQVDVDDRLPLGQAHFGHFTVLDLEQQAVAQDPGVVDQTMDRAEVFSDLGNHVGHLLFIGHVAQVGAGLDTLGLAGRDGIVEFFLIEVDQREFHALGGEILGHGTAQTLATARDNDYFVSELHSHAPGGRSEWFPLESLSICT